MYLSNKYKCNITRKGEGKDSSREVTITKNKKHDVLCLYCNTKVRVSDDILICEKKGWVIHYKCEIQSWTCPYQELNQIPVHMHIRCNTVIIKND